MQCTRRRTAKFSATEMIPNVRSHMMTKSAVFGTPLNPSANYLNSAKNTVYSRYSTADWEASNNNRFLDADQYRTASERLRSEAFRAVRIADQITRSRQENNTRKLDERMKDITLWKEELFKEIHHMDEETSNLLEHRRRLEKALADTAFPLSVAEECLSKREGRKGIDLVRDEVEACLTKEVEIIKKCQKQMKNLLDKIDIQAKMNKAEQKACELDLANKGHAYGIDDRMQQLRNSSSRLGLFPGIEDVDNTITVPATWVKFTENNLTRSQKEREKSARLRGAVDALLASCAAEMWTQHNAVDNALNSRINETNTAKSGLQTHLMRVNNEILELDRSMDLLKKAIADKLAPLKVAQTRLDERSRRIDVELCKDKPMTGLQEEVREIRESIRLLKEQLKVAEQTMNKLMKSRASLEHDISVKETSIDIDSRLCVGLRRGIGRSEPSRTGPSFSMSLAG